MNELEFISKLIEHSAWPISVVVIIILLRSNLTNIISNIKKVKVKDIELDFNETIKSIQKDINPDNKNSSKWEVTSTKYIEKNMHELVTKSPLAIILQSWDKMESIIINCSNELSNKNFNNLSLAINWLINNSKITQNNLNLYYRLNALKTRFSNFENEQLPKERALETSDVIIELAIKIESYAKKTTNS